MYDIDNMSIKHLWTICMAFSSDFPIFSTVKTMKVFNNYFRNKHRSSKKCQKIIKVALYNFQATQHV